MGVGEIFLLCLYSHGVVSAAEDWLVTSHHQNCDSLEIIMIISLKLTYLLLSLLFFFFSPKKDAGPFWYGLTPCH